MVNRLNIAGGWVDLRAPEDVPERLRRNITNLAVQSATASPDLVNGVVNNGVDLAMVQGFNDALVLAFVNNWSFNLPFTIEGILDLPGPCYDTLVKECTEMLPRLLPNFQADPDPKAPTDS
jgi:hypothetical protein